MPKLKTSSTAKKRFKQFAHGKIKRRRAFHSHLLTGKTKKRKRRLRGHGVVSIGDEKRIRRRLPYL
ncbi:MAG: 50S ribosomal protein L35 [bacterium]|nr:50S ribosomal protein L35 [bacterium]